jgi:sugar lactone lactonase YvrE
MLSGATLVALLALTGCSGPAASPTTAPATQAMPATEPSATAGTGAALRGTVQSGGTATPQGLADAKVTLYQASGGPPAELGSATTDAAGSFEIAAPGSASEGTYYMMADLGQGVVLLAVLGPELPESVTVNELTTVAGAYAAAQLYANGGIQGNPLALQAASAMSGNLVDVSTGASSTVMTTSPNADQTNGLRSTRSLANLLAAVVQDPAANAAKLFEATTPAGGSAPADTVQALVNLAKNPVVNAATLWEQSKLVEAYAPALEDMPVAWTVAVKVNDSGSDDYLPAGPAQLVFDDKGNAWITNNVTQGSTLSGKFAFVLKPNGAPADGQDGGPTSPLLGGGLLGGGYGAAIDAKGTVWLSNFGWGGDNPTPDGNGSLSTFTLQGLPTSPDDGIQGGPVRSQGIAIDDQDNVWATGFENNLLAVFPDGNTEAPITFQVGEGSNPFDLAIAEDGTAWMTNSAGSKDGVGASVMKFKLENGALTQLFAHPVGNDVKGVELDSLGNAWLASGGDSKVYQVSPDGETITGFSGGGINGPWGVAVDGDDHIWVANFGPIEPGTNFTTASVSQLAGANPATIPAGLKTGDPMGPDTGYTLPSAGEPVLLHNGDPLYGPGAPPSFQPLMRMTSVVLDQAGNIWALNNWKPDFNVARNENSGGDGVVIFVGLAKPPQ